MNARADTAIEERTLALAVPSIMEDEGFTPHWKQGILADWFIGYGFDQNGMAAKYLGEYLADRTLTISPQSARFILERVVKELYPRVVRLYGDGWNDLNDNQRSALMNMAYQLGVAGLGRFKNMLAALRKGDLRGVALHARHSPWYLEQTRARAARVIVKLVGEEIFTATNTEDIA